MNDLFWFCGAALVFLYAGYPLVIAAAGGVRPRPVRRGLHVPRLTVLISAFNEERVIAATVRNKLAQNYPREKLEILVISDGSTDRTAEIVRGFSNDGVRLIEQNPRQGKTAALNRAAAEATGDILVFSDANSVYAEDALRRLAENFSDPDVGYVTGKMVYADESGSVIGEGCGAYMRYENLLRRLETRAGSVVGVDGGIDAVRRDLYVPMRADLLPDFVLPLSVVGKRCRVVYDERALLKESALSASRDEAQMRVRVILRAWHALWNQRRLFNPFSYGLFTFQLIVHKVLRYWAGIFQIGAFVGNAFLIGQAPIYAVFLGLQIAFYLAAALGAAGPIGRRWTLLGHAYYFCLLNAAALVAFTKFLKGERRVVWQPRKG